jgi:hypothetical protein
MTTKSFYGIPLKTRRSRRMLVIGYSLLLAFFFVVDLLKPHSLNALWFIGCTLSLGGLLGGIRAGGPVKPYTSLPEGISNDPIQELKLSGPKRPWPDSIWLDEREKSERNEAHYLSYAILRWVVSLGALAWITAQIWARSWLQEHSMLLLWLFVIFVLSLPQALILWADPDDDGEDAAISANSVAGRV